MIFRPWPGRIEDRFGHLRAGGFSLLPIILSLALISLPLLRDSSAAEPKKADVGNLIEGLRSGDKFIRRDASYRLSQLGPDAVAALPDLIKALDDSEEQVWFNSITAIAHIGPDATDAIPALVKQLKEPRHEREQVLYRAAFALGSIGPAALPALTQALEDKKDRVRAGAARAIAWIGAPATNTVSLLVKNLNDGEAEVRTESAAALGKIGPTALTALESGLNSDQPNTRAGCAQALEEMGHPAAKSGPQLAAALKGETNDDARASMIHALSKFNFDPPELLGMIVPLLRSESEAVKREVSNAIILMEPAATTSVPVLKKMVDSDDPGAVKVAASFLGDIGPDAAAAVPDLIAARSRSGTNRVTQAAIDQSLVQIGAPAVPELVKVMSTAGGDTNHWSVKCLRDLGAEAVPAMIDGLHSKDAGRQRDALQVLALAGDAAESAIPDLKSMAENGPTGVRGLALTTLSLVGAKPDEVLPLAERAVKDLDPDYRRSGAAALANLGPGAKPAVGLLIKSVGDEDPSVAEACARALGKCGRVAEPAVAPLLKALKRNDTALQVAVAGALGELGGTAGGAVPTLIETLPSAPPSLQIAILRALGSMGANARSALPELEKQLSHDSPENRAASLTAIALIEPDLPRKLEMLTNALADPAPQVRVAAIEVLGKLGQAAEPAAEKLYSLTESSAERELALEVLAGLRIHSIPLLVRALGNADPYVRQYAAERLGELGKEAKDAAPDLRKLLDDKEDFVKRTARSALRSIDRAK